MTFRSLLFAFLVAVASPAAAQVWHWHTIDYEALRTGRVLWIAHARVEEDGTFLVQARVGARAAVRIKPGIDWTAGYYYGREHSKDEPWRTVNRVFTGPEIRLAKRGPATFRFRSWVEGFVREGRQDYVRFRERLHVRTSWPAGPFASYEAFFDNLDGWRGSRYQAGLRWRMGRRVMTEASYIADVRAARLGPTRHIIQTVWTLGGPHDAEGPSASDQRTPRGRQ
ncbi:MAG: DUF2490 domain-containing protein [bacterium]